MKVREVKTQEIRTAEIWIIMVCYRVIRKQTLFEKIVTGCLELFYSLTVTFFIGKWAIHAAYLERGYQAYGGEYLFTGMMFFFYPVGEQKIFRKEEFTMDAMKKGGGSLYSGIPFRSGINMQDLLRYGKRAPGQKPRRPNG